MKAIFLFFITLLALFSQQKHSNSTLYHATNISTKVTDAGLSSGTSQCNAVHFNQNDPQAYLPDVNCTPGMTNPAITQANIDSTICVSGFTKTIRPPVSYTEKLKLKQIQEYGYTDTNPKDYEEDHFISLELGGNPTSPKNLWPEPHPSINEKDTVEDYLHKQVCDGTMKLEEAQKEITQNWYAIYQQVR